MAVGKKTGGRTKGTPNKTTAAVKEAILEAFKQAGGTAYLLKVAEEDPKTFCALLGKVLPTEIAGEVDVGLTVNILRYGDHQPSE